ncbi:MAG: ABC transporter permease [Candidatus Sericytochromatia bacterium]|nr:ABC transporter permease [Candidatus Sericytochromatia bacterium]
MRVSWEGFRLAVVPVMVVAALLALALTILALGPFARLGAPSKIGALEGRLFLDELMPLLATALATARWGAGRTAEAAMMQHGGQREALRLLGVSLVRRLHFSGMVGMSLALPALTLWASWAAFLTAALTARLHAGLPLDLFWDEVLRVATPADLGLALLKAMVFGTGVGWMATHAGLASAPGPHGLSRAVSVGVVRSTWMVGVVNLLLTGMWTLR